MPLNPKEFATYYPKLYHMAEADVWPSIRKYGLLSTAALLDLFEVDRDRRHQLESEHRTKSETITHDQHGRAVIRDQKPLREGPLRKCLRNMTPQEWYEMLNGQTFLWATAERVRTLLNARAYRGRKHTVIIVDTAKFLARYADRLLLSPINSGSTIYNPPPRGRNTFIPLSSYPFDERRRTRGVKNAVVEVAVRYAIPDLRDFTMRVEHRMTDRILDVLYQKD